YLNRQRPKGEPLTQPLYTRQDASRTAAQCYSIPYDRPGEVVPEVQVRFVEAGHLLGSAMVALQIQNSAAEHTITFTGDLGRRGLPILRDPAAVPPAELLISESTYGGRTHPPVEELANGLAQVVNRTFDRGGKVLIPAFSLGRTQTVVYYLHQLIQSGRLKEIPIFMDSPLATKATEVFRLHPECFDEETAKLLAEDPDVFGQRHVHYVRSVDESKELNGRKQPCV